MANITITQIEDAMITAVSNKCKKGVAQGGYVRTVDTYGGELMGALEALTARFPCVLFEFDRFENSVLAAKGTAALARRRKLFFNIYIAAQNLRSEKKARRGTGGTYAMIEDVSDALDGQQLGLAIGAIDITDVEVIDNLPGVSAYRMGAETFTKHKTGAS